MPTPLLDIRGLTCEVAHHRILDRLDLTVQAGEIHALLGANGSGKTTLAYLLMGCDGYQASAGQVLFRGPIFLRSLCTNGPGWGSRSLGRNRHGSKASRFVSM